MLGLRGVRSADRGVPQACGLHTPGARRLGTHPIGGQSGERLRRQPTRGARL